MHKTRARVPHPTEYLANALKAHGFEAFSIKPLLIVASNEEACFYERALIKAFNTQSPGGYNLTPGGDGGSGRKKGFRLSKDACRRISESRKGKPTTLGRVRPQCEREAIGLRQLGSKRPPRTPEHCQKISAALKARASRFGITFSDQHRENISIAAKARVLRESRRGPNGQFMTIGEEDVNYACR